MHCNRVNVRIFRCRTIQQCNSISLICWEAELAGVVQVQRLRALIEGDSESYFEARHVLDVLLDFSDAKLPVEKVCVCNMHSRGITAGRDSLQNPSTTLLARGWEVNAIMPRSNLATHYEQSQKLILPRINLYQNYCGRIRAHPFTSSLN